MPAPCHKGDRGSTPAMTAKGRVSTYLLFGFLLWIASSLAMTCTHVCIVCNMGTPTLIRAGRAGHGRRAGKRPQGPSKCLTLTERRLSFDFAEVTPRPEGQALRRPQGGPIESALTFSFADFALPQHSSNKFGSAFGLRKVSLPFWSSKKEEKN